jgi:1-acyl-sn-glycerol-3-phosphate acyltransferase
MSSFFTDTDRALVAKFLSGRLSRDELAFRLIPVITLEIIRRYLRVECEGLEHIPRDRPSIIVSNHSGYAGFDALMLMNEIRRHLDITPRTVAHKLWFFGKPVRVVSEKMGLIEADMANCLKLLRQDQSLILFPEGEAGNFKPSNRRYRLQEFKRGFVRLSLITGAPIVPACVIGAEETHINLSQIKFTKYLFGTVVPLPLNVIPLPVKWKIKFLPPVKLEGLQAVDAMNREVVYRESQRIRHLIQKALIQELRTRKVAGLGKVTFTPDDEPGI